MEFSEDSMDRTLVFKGKRSKRPRQFMAVAMVTSTSSTGGGAGGGGADGGISGGDDVYNYSSSIQNSSSTTSTTQISTSSTEEDEDMANCLILLAQSGRCQKFQKLQVESTERKMMKISSRKFTEMATTTTGKAGFYVYECKTCNRTFSSFQALGGHRTSHKKIKTVTEEKKSTADSVSPSIDHHQQQEEKINRIITASVTSTQINKGNSNSHNNLINNKPKIHECSICGAEFSSGQALGGHMRRHRPPTNTKITIDETSNNTSDSSHNDDQNSKEKPKIFLSLDLNLPASPEDDHQRDTNNFEFSANQQNLVFSAAALVDCHY